MNNILYNFTRAFSSGITLLRTVVRSILPNLYVINESPSSDKTPLIYDGDYPDISPQAYGTYLDYLGEMFNLERNLGESDSSYRRRIIFSIGRSSTKSGIKSSLDRLFSTYSSRIRVTIKENFNDFFDGTSSTFDVPMRDPKGSMLYGITIIVEPLALEGSREVVDENGIVLYRKVDYFNLDTFEFEEKEFGTNVFWKRIRSPYLGSLIDSFGVVGFRELLEDISAAGIKIDRVIIKEPAAGGSR